MPTFQPSGFLIFIPIAVVVALFIAALVTASHKQMSLATNLAIACVVMLALVLGIIMRSAVMLPHVTKDTLTLVYKGNVIDIESTGHTSIVNALQEIDGTFNTTLVGEVPILNAFVKENGGGLYFYNGRLFHLSSKGNGHGMQSKDIKDTLNTEREPPVLIKALLGYYAVGHIRPPEHHIKYGD